MRNVVQQLIQGPPGMTSYQGGGGQLPMRPYVASEAGVVDDAANGRTKLLAFAQNGLATTGVDPTGALVCRAQVQQGLDGATNAAAGSVARYQLPRGNYTLDGPIIADQHRTQIIGDLPATDAAGGTQLQALGGALFPVLVIGGVVPIPSYLSQKTLAGASTPTTFFEISESGSGVDAVSLNMAQCDFGSLNGLQAFSHDLFLTPASGSPGQVGMILCSSGSTVGGPYNEAYSIELLWASSTQVGIANVRVTTSQSGTVSVDGRPSPSGPSSGTWMTAGTTYHIRVVYDGSQVRLYQQLPNGASFLQGSVAASGHVVQKPWESWYIGGNKVQTFPRAGLLVGPAYGCEIAAMRFLGYCVTASGASFTAPNKEWDNNNLDTTIIGITSSSGTPSLYVEFTGTPSGTIEIAIETAGALGTATFSWSINGVTQATNVPTASAVVLGTSGVTAHFGAGTYYSDNTFTDYRSYATLFQIGFAPQNYSGRTGFQWVASNRSTQYMNRPAQGSGAVLVWTGMTERIDITVERLTLYGGSIGSYVDNSQKVAFRHVDHAQGLVGAWAQTYAYEVRYENCGFYPFTTTNLSYHLTGLASHYHQTYSDAEMMVYRNCQGLGGTYGCVVGSFSGASVSFEHYYADISGIASILASGNNDYSGVYDLVLNDCHFYWEGGDANSHGAFVQLFGVQSFKKFGGLIGDGVGFGNAISLVATYQIAGGGAIEIDGADLSAPGHPIISILSQPKRPIREFLVDFRDVLGNTPPLLDPANPGLIAAPDYANNSVALDFATTSGAPGNADWLLTTNVYCRQRRLVFTDTTNVLTASRNIVAPFLYPGYWHKVVNLTAYPLTFKGSSGTTVTVPAPANGKPGSVEILSQSTGMVQVG